MSESEREFIIVEKPDHYMCGDCGGSVAAKCYADGESQYFCKDCESDLNIIG